MRTASLVAAFITGTTFASFFALAWTGPTSAPPNGNISAPINVGTTDQIKNAGLGINSLAVFGNAILSGTSRYLNFGTTAGPGGYGIRDNAGTMEFKNSGGSWGAFLSTSTSSGISAQIFTSSGTFTVPSGVTAVKVILIGGGGGVDANVGCVGGGGAGGTATKWLSGLTPGANMPVVVGAGGRTTDGGASSFGGVIAYGGSKNVSNNPTLGGAGGSTSGADLGVSGESGSGGACASHASPGAGGASRGEYSNALGYNFGHGGRGYTNDVQGGVVIIQW